MAIPRNRAITALLGVITTVLVGWVLHVGAGILQPLVIAILLASLLSPVVRGLARWHIPPFVTVILLATLLFFGLARLGLLLQANVNAFLSEQAAVPSPPRPPPRTVDGDDYMLVQGFDFAVRLLTGVRLRGSAEDTAWNPLMRIDPMSREQEQLSQQVGGWHGVLDRLSLRMQESSVPEPLNTFLIDTLRELELREVAAGLIGSGFDFTRGLVLVIIYMVFMFAEQAVFRRKILSVVRRSDTPVILDTIARGIQRYLGVKTIMSLATGALCYVVLVALDIPYALLYGFLTFILNYIPTFGSIVAGAFPTITALATGPFYKVMIVVSTYLAVNLLLGSFLEPRILGRELDLSPLVIVISVVVWAGIWGVVGTFLAVPLTAAMQIILASAETTRPIAVLLSSGPPRDT